MKRLCTSKLDVNELLEAVEVVLRFGGKLKRDNFTVYIVKDRVRIDLVIREEKDEHGLEYRRIGG